MLFGGGDSFCSIYLILDPKKNLGGIFLNQNFGFTYFGGWLVKYPVAKSNFSYLVGWLVNGGSETRRIYQILEFGPGSNCTSGLNC